MLFHLLKNGKSVDFPFKLLSALRGAEKKKLAFDIEKMTKTSREGESA